MNSGALYQGGQFQTRFAAGIFQAIGNDKRGFNKISVGNFLYGLFEKIRTVKRYENIWSWYHRATKASLLVVLTEAFGAMVGSVIATACVCLTWATGDPHWEARGSIKIGALLVIMAFLPPVGIKSLLIGEAPGRNYRKEIEKIMKECLPQGRLLNFIELQTGDNEVLVSMKQVRAVPFILTFHSNRKEKARGGGTAGLVRQAGAGESRDRSGPSFRSHLSVGTM